MAHPLCWLTTAGVLFLAAPACGTSDGPAAAVEGVAIERTTAAPTTTIPVPVELLPASQMTREHFEAIARDWEGQRFDFGVVRRVDNEGRGWTLTFDRAQIRDEHGVRDGPTLETEPIYIGDTGGITVSNTNPRLRTFAVDPNAEVLLLSPKWSCANDQPSWELITVEQLASAPSALGGQDALTFDSSGQVTRIRLARGCS